MSHNAYCVDLDPDTETSLKVYLFKNVQNVEDIRNNIIKGAWKCAIVKPSLIIDPFQLAVAANRAVLAEKFNSMVTRTIFAEILFNLSISKNISQSLSKFGIEKDKELLVCILGKQNDKITEDNNIIDEIQGEICPISELNTFSNVKDIKQVYKLNNMQCDNDLRDLVVSRMVTKSIVTH